MLQTIFLWTLWFLVSIHSAQATDLSKHRVDHISHLTSDTAKAHQYYLKGLEILTTNPDDLGGKAVEAFRKANRHRPSFYWETYYWIAYFTYFKDPDALYEMDEAINIVPKKASLYAFRATIKLHWRDNLGALSDIHWALIFDAKDAKFYLQRALILKRMSLYEEAKNDCTTALALDPNYTKAYAERALLYLELGLKEAACADFKQAKALGFGWTYQMKECGMSYEE